MRSYYVYVMGNRSGTLYIGVTNNLQRRILEHRAGLGGFTRKYRLVKLLYYEVTRRCLRRNFPRKATERMVAREEASAHP